MVNLSLGSILVLLAASISYYFIFTEKIERTAAAFLGAVSILLIDEVFHVFKLHEFIYHVDFSVIALLFSMMVITEVMKKTGLFEYLTAIISVKFYDRPILIMSLILLITAYVSMVLANVTTLIIILPIAIHIAKLFRINIPFFLMALAIFANVGGIATLIGDPPNVIIAAKAGFDFLSFLKYMFIPTNIIMFAMLAYIYIMWKDRIKPLDKKPFDEEKIKSFIKNAKLLKTELWLIVIMLILFIVWDDAALIASTFAVIFVLVGKENLEESGKGQASILANIEWSSLLFFICLFIIVGALEEIGVLKFLAVQLGKALKYNLLLAGVILLLVSSIISGVVDNIPFTIAMVEVMKYLIKAHIITPAFWWILALGVGIGGNFTPIGASPNVLAMAKLKQLGYKVKFKDWFKFTLGLSIICLIISLIYSVILVKLG